MPSLLYYAAGRLVRPGRARPSSATPTTIQNQAAASERARVGGIVRSPEARGREELARSLAFESNLSVADAIAALRAAAPAAPAAPRSTGATADQLAGLDAALARRVARARRANSRKDTAPPLDAATRALIEQDLRALPSDTADVGLAKAVARNSVRLVGMEKSARAITAVYELRAGLPVGSLLPLLD